MGTRKSRRDRFFEQHPQCCFCGGLRAAVQIDHVPSRAKFFRRQWPIGYSFPACEDCNRATRLDEQVVAMLSRAYPDGETELERAEMESLMTALSNFQPDVLEEMRLTTRSIRQAVRKYRLEKPAGLFYRDLPVLATDGPRVRNAVEKFARKLFCALFYKHAAAILPPNGGIAVRWYSNLQVNADEIPRELGDVLAEFGRVERSNINLDDQFFYRWGISETRTVMTTLAMFRRSFAIVGFVNIDSTNIKLPATARIVKPWAYEK